MTNAQILANSLNQWATPIVQGAMNNMAQQSQLGYFMSALIAPERLMQSFQNYIATPVLIQYTSKVPDAMIPELAIDLIDGMIEQRAKNGDIEIPFIGARLSPAAFKELKTICESNFSEYGEVVNAEKQQ